MASILWDSQEVVIIDYLEQGTLSSSERSSESMQMLTHQSLRWSHTQESDQKLDL